MTGREVWTIHTAGEYSDSAGQLCVRCGFVLDTGLDGKAWQIGTDPPRGWTPGDRILVSPFHNPSMMLTVDAADPERDRSDEIECEMIGGDAGCV